MDWADLSINDLKNGHSEDGKGGLVRWYNPVWWNPDYLPTEHVDLLTLRHAFEKVGYALVHCTFVCV